MNLDLFPFFLFLIFYRNKNNRSSWILKNSEIKKPVNYNWFFYFNILNRLDYSPASVHSKFAFSTEQRAFFNTDIIAAS